jgi:hypothetical protein
MFEVEKKKKNRISKHGNQPARSLSRKEKKRKEIEQ